MTTITKEEVKAFIEQIESDLANGWEAQIFELKLARIALASLDAEPVAWTSEGALAEVYCGETGVIGPKYIVGDVPLYRHAQPAPVVPEECPEEIRDLMASHSDALFNDDDAQEIWNACRAAMLQGAEPVSNRDELQVIGWLRSDYNSDDKRDPNAPLFMLGSNDPSEAWGVKYIPLSGNSSAIPDGWIICSERMPEDEQEVIVHNKLGYRYVSYFDEHSGLFFDMRGGNQMNCIEHIFVTHWMPAPAAPKPEINNE
ncbi:TPA: DUF551 domain-containing protein [Salmonella enterica]|nr:DUF551 domain-containing protein [Salmonella enterica]